MNSKNIKIAVIAGITATTGSLFAGVPLNNLQGTGGIAFNPLAYTAGLPWDGDSGGDTTNAVEHSVLNGSEQLFAAKYVTYLPTQEQLRQEIERQKAFYAGQLEGDC